MNKYEALQLLGLTGTLSQADIKRAYKRKAQEFHPDRNPAGLELMKMINVAYDLVKNEDKITVATNQTMADYPEVLSHALKAILAFDLQIEICGLWIWVSGDTKPHKEALKNAGYLWAPKKACWYFRPADRKSFNRKSWSMDKIRSAYGSDSFKKERYYLAQ